MFNNVMFNNASGNSVGCDKRWSRHFKNLSHVPAPWSRQRVQSGFVTERTSTLELRQVQSLEVTRGARLVCTIGSLWITQRGDARDYLLRAGETFMVQNNGKLLVQALTRAAFSVTQ
jgi:hypothetical protein